MEDEKFHISRCVNFNFFNFYLAAPQPTLGHYRRGSLTNPVLIIVLERFQSEGYREPHNKVGSLSPAGHLVGFEAGPF